MPDTSASAYRYLHVRDTPLKINGKIQEVDDFQRRRQIKQALAAGTLLQHDEEQTELFCNKYLVEKHLLMACVNDIRTKQLKKEKSKIERKHKTEEEKGKKYSDFNWIELFETGNLKILLVGSLNKYIMFHKLDICLSMIKKKKIDIIMKHISSCLLKKELKMDVTTEKRLCSGHHRYKYGKKY